jgi:predicted AAA+ superfamily ATPase
VKTKSEADLGPLLYRIADALERLAPAATAVNDLDGADAFIWHAEREWLEPIPVVNRVALGLLRGIDRVRDILLDNTKRFAAGLPANNVLLWGARGTGKSALVKAVHAAINDERPHALALIEIHREDIPSLPRLLSLVRGSPRRCLLFCDDLSFDQNDTSYKSLKAVLEGGIEGRPGNVVLYATSNRRHLMARDMIDNERSTAINPAEAVEEKVSLSDRFGLWLGFHNVDQDTYQAIVRGYARHFDLRLPEDQLKAEANEWSITRGARSGRVAWQFIQDLAGRLGKPTS